MVYQQEIINNLVALKNKLEWLKTFFEYSCAISRKSADLFHKATLIPRDSNWKDPYILEIVEIGNQQRILCEELCDFHEMTIIKDTNNLLKLVDEEIDNINNEHIDIENKLNGFLADLNEKRKRHCMAWGDDKSDPWITELELKEAITTYVKHNLTAKKDLDKTMKKYEDTWITLIGAYKEIHNNYINIQKNHYKNFYLSLDDSQKRNFIQTDENECFYDIPSDEEKPINQIEKIEMKAEEAFNAIIDDISSELLRTKGILISKNVQIRKYGVYLYKRGYQNNWIPYFFIVTEKRFLHCYEIDRTKYPEFKSIFDKIYVTRNKGILNFFESSAKGHLGYNESNELQLLNKAILKRLSNQRAVKKFPIRLIGKSIVLESNKLEINITSSNTSNFTNFFGSNQIRIRGLLRSEINDLYEAMIKESVNDSSNESVIKEIVKTEHTNIQANKLASFIAYEEENPWVE
ncbi:hypothetical protein TCON_2254 [Astathelohania contejeani]|uniref:PH domain-containing protein n=1 Tax=Astathelohania contejeani TaxID=164912 RepID=A0ABQ7HWM3_9MICR|nr:hypothetical protein TCON_2254 [Thelohania contejeani]